MVPVYSFIMTNTTKKGRKRGITIPADLIGSEFSLQELGQIHAMRKRRKTIKTKIENFPAWQASALAEIDEIEQTLTGMNVAFDSDEADGLSDL